MRGALIVLIAVCAFAAPGPSAPFMQVTLKMAPFKGADAAETRRRADRFIAELGLPVLGCQDNEAVRAATVRLPPAPEGLLDRIQFGLRKSRVFQALRGRPNVSEVYGISDGASATVLFSPFVYSDEAQSLAALLPDGYRLEVYRNPAMSGLWVKLDVSKLDDPAKAARELARRYPEQVDSAVISVPVMVMRATMRRR
ncbi:MAG: hypothetical protein HYV14_14515 [Elusimicrobia bacterium]|nr:hypothetical protein [Elusimicrobiota bacterium]